MACRVDKTHDLFRERPGLLRVVRDAHEQERIGPAHDAEADLAAGARRFSDYLKRVIIRVDHVVEEVYGVSDRLLQQRVVEVVAACEVFFQHLHEVDRAEVAALVRKQRLLAARVGALDLAYGRGHVVAVQPVEEDDPRLAVLPRVVDDQIKDLARRKVPDRQFRLRVDQVVVGVLLHGVHERLRDPDADVEVRYFLIICLAVDEIDDIRVVDSEDAHVRTAPRSALLDGFRRRVEDLHETDRAAGDASRGTYGRPALSEARE